MAVFSGARGQIGRTLAQKAINCVAGAMVVWIFAGPIGGLVYRTSVREWVQRTAAYYHYSGGAVVPMCASVPAGLLGAAAVVLGVVALCRERFAMQAVVATILGAMFAGVALVVLVPGV